MASLKAAIQRPTQASATPETTPQPRRIYCGRKVYGFWANGIRRYHEDRRVVEAALKEACKRANKQSSLLRLRVDNFIDPTIYEWPIEWIYAGQAEYKHILH